MRYTWFILLSLVCLCGYSQESELLLKYRRMALEYNHDIKSARENISASMQLLGAAKADLAPKIGAGASYQYVGHPMELNLNSASLGVPLHFQGQNNQYGVSLSLDQPIYAGGRLLAALKKAQFQQGYAENELLLLRNIVSQQSDMTYWNSVAKGEIVQVAKESKSAVEELVRIVRQRVEAGFSDPNDLLMAEVKLNEAEYLLQQTETFFSTSLMSLNSLIGLDLNIQTEIDPLVVPITTVQWDSLQENGVRPEQIMAQKQMEMLKSDKKIVTSKYLPQMYIGAQGSFQSPSYDFTPQMKPNYEVYAKLSVPIFEWGKGHKESRAAQSRINAAAQNMQKIEDKIDLEISSSQLSLSQAIEQVNLTKSSLEKASLSEKRSMERYSEGRLSIMEVLQSQLYRQNAQMNYTQAKLAAQNAWSELQRALNLYNE